MSSDREEFEEARRHGLRKRHKQRLSRYRYRCHAHPDEIVTWRGSCPRCDEAAS